MSTNSLRAVCKVSSESFTIRGSFPRQLFCDEKALWERFQNLAINRMSTALPIQRNLFPSPTPTQILSLRKS
jgi:hypothetical protein